MKIIHLFKLFKNKVFGNKSTVSSTRRDNAVPAVLIDEMYESLIFSGDR